MKKQIKNIDIDKMLKTLNSGDAFTGKIPYAIRHALRVNKITLAERMKIYGDERIEILQKAVDDGFAVRDGDNIIVDEAHKQEIIKDITELSQVENNLDFETIDSNTLEAYLMSHDLSMQEEDILLFFEAE